MSRESFEGGNWQAVIEAHPLESHDPQEWLRYGIALLQTLTPGPDVSKQQQQAALAFMQAQKEGASAAAVTAAQQRSVLISIAQALDLAGIGKAAQRVMPTRWAVLGSRAEQTSRSDAVAAGSPAMAQLLLVLAGFYSLEPSQGGGQMEQILEVKRQLRERGITTESVRLALFHARHLRQELPEESIKQLLDVLA